MATYKKYIHEQEINERIRDDISFSDSTKIRMYSDMAKPGIRLKSTFNTYSQVVNFPTDDDLYVVLPEWSPQALKGFLTFQEVSTKPTGTTITWRLSDGTTVRYWDGAAWSAATLSSHWNTELEIAANISTFPWVQKKIIPHAKLKTTDKLYTPVLYSYSIMINGDFDWYKDMFVDSMVPYLRTHYRFLIDHTGTLDTGASTVNLKTNANFIPEQDINIVDVDAVYNHTDDPNHFVNIFSSYNSGTGVVTLTGAVDDDTTLWLVLEIEPEIIVNTQHTDYIELGKTPSVVIESINVYGYDVDATKEIVDKYAETGWKTDYPKYCKNIDINVIVISPLHNELMVLMEKSDSIATIGLGDRPFSLHSVGLDEYYSLCSIGQNNYNPRPNFTDLKSFQFGLKLENVYIWTRDVTEASIVTSFETDMESEENPAQSKEPQDLPGVLQFLYTIELVED